MKDGDLIVKKATGNRLTMLMIKVINFVSGQNVCIEDIKNERSYGEIRS